MSTRLLLSLALLLAGCGTAPREPEAPPSSPMAPPPDRAEIHGPPAEAGQAWVSGHWAWRETVWEWIPGRFEVAPRPDAIWVPGSWVERGGEWWWTEGDWK